MDRERFTMVVIIERKIVAETCFRRKEGIGSKSHCLFRRGMQKLTQNGLLCISPRKA